MSIGLVGRKSGMTRVFTAEGNSIPVTVVEVQPNRVTQVKTPESDGYSAIQVTTGSRRASRVNKAMAGHFAKANTEAGDGLWEFRTEGADTAELGTQRDAHPLVDMFEAGAGFILAEPPTSQHGSKFWNYCCCCCYNN